ncbi:MAG: hypothetical protein EXS42_05140 [Lacunisphaera sp.]|nr:hypothetical protein [Lacunisphaera sp.]
MIPRILLPLALALAVNAAAVVVEVNLPYKNLRLKDGMFFTEVAVKSLNTSAGTVVLLVNKDLISLRTTLLPDEVNARLKEMTPVQSKEELETGKNRRRLAGSRPRKTPNAAKKWRRTRPRPRATPTGT